VEKGEEGGGAQRGLERRRKRIDPAEAFLFLEFFFFYFLEIN
jgi:hypothetical protein